MCCPEVTVTTLHPPRLCRIAVFSIKPKRYPPFSLAARCWRMRAFLGLAYFFGFLSPLAALAEKKMTRSSRFFQALAEEEDVSAERYRCVGVTVRMLLHMHTRHWVTIWVSDLRFPPVSGYGWPRRSGAPAVPSPSPAVPLRCFLSSQCCGFLSSLPFCPHMRDCPIRSLGRLPVGLGSSNNTSVTQAAGYDL